jgi:hypothetical protein
MVSPIAPQKFRRVKREHSLKVALIASMRRFSPPSKRIMINETVEKIGPSIPNIFGVTSPNTGPRSSPIMSKKKKVGYFCTGE